MSSSLYCRVRQNDFVDILFTLKMCIDISKSGTIFYPVLSLVMRRHVSRRFGLKWMYRDCCFLIIYIAYSNTCWLTFHLSVHAMYYTKISWPDVAWFWSVWVISVLQNVHLVAGVECFFSSWGLVYLCSHFISKADTPENVHCPVGFILYWLLATHTCVVHLRVEFCVFSTGIILRDEKR